MSDFLLELRSEEIPARMQVAAKADLVRLFESEIAKAGLKADRVEAFATPRRLALIAYGLPDATQAVREETKGPKASAPPQALEGFLRKVGLTREQLEERDGVLFAVVDKPGRATADVLADAIPAVVRAFPWPKSMRWGVASSSTESLRWVRPLQGIVALFGGDVVACEVEGVSSGRTTMGHRFHTSAPVEIADAGAYVEALRAAHVIVHFSERCDLIRGGADKAAAAAGLTIVPDEGLVIENAGLTEWPVPMLGRFDAAYLGVPPEVIQLTARVNQKYFVCHNGDGKLANAFVCTANIDASDGGKAIVAGNERVLAARLSDAKFFWDNDLKVPLVDQAAKLSQIVFHEKLGTVADKVDRVAKLAEWLATEKIVPNCDAALARRAAELCKADLVTGMVGEFPELQGVIGGYLAERQGEAPQVAAAIRDHYKPVGAGDDVPTDPVTVAVSLADKLDTISAFFVVSEKPTGSKDPFALRRAGISLIALILKNGLRAPVWRLVLDPMVAVQTAIQIEKEGKDLAQTLEGLEAIQSQGVNLSGILGPLTRELDRQAEVMPRQASVAIQRAIDDLRNFLADRLKVQQREAGVRHDLIDAVFALGEEDDLVRLLSRVKALQSFIQTTEGKDLHAAYKRSANILKQAGDALGGEGSRAPDQVRGDEENALGSALDAAEPRATAAIESEDFEGAMSALATLRVPIDAFFEGVMINDPDPQKRAFRLGLLQRFRDAVHRVADFSKIEG